MVMRPRLLVIVVAALGASASTALAAPGDISTVAGSTLGLSGDGAAAAAAQLDWPKAVAPMPDGGFLIADTFNHRIRRVLPNGTIATAAGTSMGFSGDHGPATAAQLIYPGGVAITPDGGFLIVDSSNQVVRKVSAGGTIDTVAGLPGQTGFSGDGGPAVGAKLDDPLAVAALPDGGFLIADTYNHRIRRVFANGTIVTVAGTTLGYDGDGGPAAAARLAYPAGVAVTPDGGFLIADTFNQRVRQVRPDGTIVTVAGAGAAGLAGDGGAATSALLNYPCSATPTADGGFLIADTNNDRIRRVSPAGTITTVAGTTHGLSGDGGPATAAQLAAPAGMAVTANGGLLIADTGNFRVRLVSGAATGGGPVPIAPVTSIAHGRAAAFGAKTKVFLSLTHARIGAAGRLGLTVRNANVFALSGSLRGRSRGIALATKRFAVAARGRTRLALRLDRRLRARLRHTGKLAVVLTARIADPSGHVRRVTRTLTVRRAITRHR
jgi:hypothetical protein